MEFCRVLQEWKDGFAKFIYADVRLYVLCFASEKEMNQFIRSFKECYIMYLNRIDPREVLEQEPGRALQVYYDRFEFKDVPHVFYMRILGNSLAFYNQTNKKKDCLQEVVSFNEIWECNVEYGHFLRMEDIRNNPNVSCCISYNRTVNEEYNTKEYICSNKETIEMCVFEARIMQKEIGEKCARFQENGRINVSHIDIYQEFLSEDRKIRQEVELEPRDRANIDCCIC